MRNVLMNLSIPIIKLDNNMRMSYVDRQQICVVRMCSTMYGQ